MALYAEEKAANKSRKEHLKAILTAKENQELEEKSVDEIKKLIDGIPD